MDSKEPWTVKDFEEGKLKSIVSDEHIIAAVNACEGISTEALKGGGIKELVGALEEIVFANVHGDADKWNKSVDRANAALELIDS
ncbi:hypothetical protein KAR91_37165 [Candidatus Pacearchaeota archaeon]|nr:hypothetical protein [Candidatus Pacearchaeota archaeon]